MNYKNCRWIYPNYTEDKDICLNGAIEEEMVNDEICRECSRFYSYLDDENIKIVDEDTESLINAD